MTVDFRALLTEPTPRAVRAVALDLLDVLDAEQARLDRAADAEALHDFRVALRRLRSWLRAYRADVRDTVGRKTLRALGRLADATTDSRDLEVHLEWLAAEAATFPPTARRGAKFLALRLGHEKARADAALRETIGGRFAETSAKLRKNLSRYAVAVWDRDGTDRWATTAASRVQDAFVALRKRLALVDEGEDDARLHRARIAGKRLRYLLEPLDGVVDGAREAIARLKTLQDALGAMHDAHVLARYVRRHARSVTPPARRSRRTTDARTGMHAVARALRARRSATWEAFAPTWLDQEFARLGDGVHDIVRALREIAGEGVEIERKYLLRRLPPEAKQAPALEIEQGYLPGTKLVERLRRVTSGDDVRFFRTVKSGSGVVRIELEDETTAATFRQMWPLTEGRRLRKRRYRLADAGQVWEIDEFRDRKLVLAEIELASARDAVVIPDWLARCLVREVTGEPEYLNSNLAS